MAKIHGIVYVLIGAFITLVSWKIDFKDLMAFFYVGLFFIAAGLFKMMFSLMKKNEDRKISHHKTQHQSHNQNVNLQRAHQGMHSQKVYHQAHQSQTHSQYKRCTRCHNVMRIHDSFCSKCGNRV